MEVRHIAMTVTEESAKEDLELLDSALGEGGTAAKFTVMVFDLGMAGPRILLASLAFAYRTALRYDVGDAFIGQLRDMASIPGGSSYDEMLQRYMALAIVGREAPGITMALPEHKVLGDKNPDWTIRTESGGEFYIEVSAISIGKPIDDLQAFNGHIATGKIKKAWPEPLYFEIIFEDNPRTYDADAIVRAVVGAAKAGRFPSKLSCGSARIMVDLLASRDGRHQIISDEIADTEYLKSTRLMGGELAYTLATKVAMKTVNTKIDEKKKANRLDKIGNCWLCLFVDSLDNIADDAGTIATLERRVENSLWLDALILAGLHQGTDGSWDLHYLLIGNPASLQDDFPAVHS